MDIDPQASASGADAAELRASAEARLSFRNRDVTSDIGRLVHELEVHQVELEIQNQELRETRAALEASLKRYTDLYDLAPMGLFTLSRSSAILQTNLAGACLLGATPEELADVPLLTFLAPVDRAGFQTFLGKVFSSLGKEAREIDLHLPSGERRTVLFEASPVENGLECRCVAVDVTERNELERHLLRAQRMESIGTLAGGVAHDLNNVLCPILMTTDVLRTRLSDAPGLAMLDLIAKSARHGADLVNQVLTFARGAEGPKIAISVSALIRDIELLMDETLLKTIRIEAAPAPDVWPVLGDRTQLHQVLLNLCVNARDAMPNGGRIRLSAGNLPEGIRHPHFSKITDVPYVFLLIEDHGTGMAPEVVEKIFDPFFTTKQLGAGTGLGLSTAMGIVTNHGGFIHVESRVGEGTRFFIYLPAHLADTALVAPLSPAPIPFGGGQLILVVDDENAVRIATKMTLETFGYRVELAQGGNEAVTTYQAMRSEIDLVLTDLMMPVLDGPATILALKSINPRLPIIAASGISTSDSEIRAAELGVDLFVPKPYGTEALLRAIHETLAAARQESSSVDAPAAAEVR